MAVPAVVLVMLTGVVVPKLQLGKSSAPDGLEVSAQVRATLPVNPPLGVTVMVEVLPLAAPGATETAEPVIAKLALEALVTVRVTGADVEAAYVVSPL